MKLSDLDPSSVTIVNPAPEPQTGLPESLVEAVIQAESGGRPDAVSGKGAVGLMQIMPETALDPGFGMQGVDPTTLTDPDVNRRFGTEYLGKLLERYGNDPRAALAAYNMGPGAYDKITAAGGELYPETRDYLNKLEPAISAMMSGQAPASPAPAATEAPLRLSDLQPDSFKVVEDPAENTNDAFLRAFSASPAATEAPPEEGERSQFMTGFTGYLASQGPDAIGSFLEAVGLATGSEFTKTTAAEWVRDLSADPAQYHPNVAGWEDIDWGAGVLEVADQVTDFLSYGLGNGIASTLPSMVVGFGGAVAGGSVGGLPGAAAGGVAGAFGPSYVQNTGPLFDELVKEGMAPERAATAAMLGGIALAGLDAVFPAKAAITNQVKRQVRRNLAKRLKQEFAEGAITEGITEMLQGVVQEAIVTGTTEKEVNWKEVALEAINSATLGALTGGVMGGVMGTLPDRAAEGDPVPPPAAPGAGPRQQPQPPEEEEEQQAPGTPGPEAAQGEQETGTGVPSPEPEPVPPPAPDETGPGFDVPLEPELDEEASATTTQEQVRRIRASDDANVKAAERGLPPVGDQVRITDPEDGEAEIITGTVNQYTINPVLEQLEIEVERPDGSTEILDVPFVTVTPLGKAPESPVESQEAAAPVGTAPAETPTPAPAAPQEPPKKTDPSGFRVRHVRNEVGGKPVGPGFGTPATLGGTFEKTTPWKSHMGKDKKLRRAIAEAAANEAYDFHKPEFSNRHSSEVMGFATFHGPGDVTRSGTRLPKSKMAVSYVADPDKAIDDPDRYESFIFPVPKKEKKPSNEGAKINVPPDVAETVKKTAAAEKEQIDREEAEALVEGPESGVEGTIFEGEEPAADLPGTGTTTPEPSDAQREAGNYEKRKFRWQGEEVSVETEKGGIRRSMPDAEAEWEVEMPVAYGYFRRTVGDDQEQLDVFIGDNLDSDRVFVVDQRHVTQAGELGGHDEMKVLIGFDTPQQARKAYADSFSDGLGAKRISGFQEYTVEEFKKQKVGKTFPAEIAAAVELDQTAPAPEPKVQWGDSLYGMEKGTIEDGHEAELMLTSPSKGVKKYELHFIAEGRTWARKPFRSEKAAKAGALEFYRAELDEYLAKKVADDIAKQKFDEEAAAPLTEDDRADIADEVLHIAETHGNEYAKDLAQAVLDAGFLPNERVVWDGQGGWLEFNAGNWIISDDDGKIIADIDIPVMAERIQKRPTGDITARAPGPVQPDLLGGPDVSEFHLVARESAMEYLAQAEADGMETEDIIEEAKALYEANEEAVDARGLMTRETAYWALRQLMDLEAVNDSGYMSIEEDADAQRNLSDSLAGTEPGEVRPDGEGGPVGSPSDPDGDTSSRPDSDGDQAPADDGAPTEGVPEEGGESEPVSDGSDGTDDTGDGGVLGPNYRISPTENLGTGGAKKKARENLEAIRIVKQLEAENRPATAEEQAKLVRYVGWGASELANNMFEDPNTGAFREGWETLAGELQDLLTAKEYETAKRSTQYAHYTSQGVIEGIWKGLGQMGFKGGRILEPGMGTGNFIGLLPDGMQKSTYTGIEFDGITAAIAKALYPQSTVRHEDFTESRLPDGYFDVAIGNPPFSSRIVKNDRKYRRFAFPLHDYFLAKTLDKVREGGLMVLISSRYTMDKISPEMRQYVHERADFVGAYRLPQTAFKQNAGTDVVTDIMIFRKHDGRVDKEISQDWLKTEEREIDGHRYHVNEYYSSNKKNILGEEAATGSMYGSQEYTVKPTGTGTQLENRLKHAVDKLPPQIYKPAPKPVHEVDNEAAAAEFDPKIKKEGSYYVDDKGALRQVIDGAGQAVPIGPMSKLGPNALQKGKAEIVKSYVPVRDAVRQVLKDQLEGGDGKAAQKTLNKVYDAFVKKHGPINKVQTRKVKTKDGYGEAKSYPTLSAFIMDPDAHLIAALEIMDEETGRVTKADIFTSRVVEPAAEPKVENAHDALNVVLNQFGRVDMAEVAKALETSEEEAAAELGDAVYLDPETGDWVTDDEYLSGNVREKLAAAKNAAKNDEQFQRNAKALEEVQPEELPPSKITVRLGAGWVDPADVARFAAERLELDVDVNYLPQANLWAVNRSAGGRTGQEWATRRRSAFDIFDAILNNRPLQVYDTFRGPPQTRELNKQESAAAVEKGRKMKEAFQSWIWEDPDRAERLAAKYNQEYNALVPRTFNGNHLTLPGQSKSITLRPHQKRVVWRIMSTGNTYMAHTVGAGKTMAMVTAGMEMKRLGIVQKPLYIVPNHMLRQFSNELLQLYPTAKILVADDKNFHKDRRKQFLGKVTTGNWDGVIITHSAYKYVQPSPDLVNRIIARELAELEEILTTVGKDDDDRVTRKRLEAQKEKLEARLKKMTEVDRDDLVTFEETGIDFQFVDEAHEFRKLYFATNMGNVKGIDPNGSERAMDLYIKSRYLEARTPGRSTVLASGTAITNTLGEMYTVQRFLQEQVLQEGGIHKFDAWATMFGDTVSNVESTPSGGYQQVTRFAKFMNLPELVRMFRDVADVITSDQLNIPRPAVKGGKRQLVIAERNEPLKKYQKHLEARAEVIKNRKGKPQKGDDILLSVITDGRHAAIDPRYFGSEPDPDHPSKLDVLIDKAMEVHEETKDNEYTLPDGSVSSIRGAAQIIFADLGSPAALEKRGFSSYVHIRNQLIQRGIPKSEIAFIQEANTDDKKARLIQDVNTGKVKFLIGGSGMETGLNAQARLIALHHQDAPWVPSSVEQREGRIIRQGNQNEEVQVYAYATKGTYDQTMWQLLETKQRFIDQMMTGDLSIRESADVSSESADQFALAKALSSGDDRIIELVGLQSEIEQLERLRSAHHDDGIRLSQRKKNAKGRVDYLRKALPLAREDAERATSTRGDAFEATIEGKKYKKRDKAAEALSARLQEMMVGREIGEGIPLGSIGGFDIMIERPTPKSFPMISFDTKGNDREIDAEGFLKSPRGVIQRLENSIHEIMARPDWVESELVEAEASLESAEKVQHGEFDREGELAEKIARAQQIERELHDEGKDELFTVTNAFVPLDFGTELKRPRRDPGALFPGTDMDITPGRSKMREESRRRQYSILDGGRSADRPLDAEGLERLSQRSRRRIAKKIRASLDKIAPGVSVALADHIESSRSEEAVRVSSSAEDQLIAPGGYHQNGLIALSMDVVGMGSFWRDTTVGHEAIHYLKAHGFFSDREWEGLEREAKDKWISFFDLPNEPDNPQVVEEAIAYAFGLWYGNKRNVRIQMGRIFHRIMELLKRIAAIFHGEGFKSAGDIYGPPVGERAQRTFQQISSGEVGRRASAEWVAVRAMMDDFDLDEPTAKAAVAKADDDLATIKRQFGSNNDISYALAQRMLGQARSLLTEEVAVEGVQVEEATREKDLNPLKRYIYVPSSLFREWPQLQRAVKRWTKRNADMQSVLTRLQEDWDNATTALNPEEFNDLGMLLFRGDSEETQFSRQDLENMVDEDGAPIEFSAATIEAYQNTRTLMEKIGRLVDSHERGMRAFLRKRIKPQLLRQIARSHPDLSRDQVNRLIIRRYKIRARIRSGNGNMEQLNIRLAAVNRQLGYDPTAEEQTELGNLVKALDTVDAQLNKTSFRRRDPETGDVVEGYMPHKFFGSWAVYRMEPRRDEDGNRYEQPVLVSEYAEHGFHNSRQDAVRAANLIATGGDGDGRIVVRPVAMRFVGAQGATLPRGRYEQLIGQMAESLEVENSDIREAVDGKLKPRNRRKWAGFKQQRMGIEGYSRDLDRILRTHIGEVTRYVHLDKVKYEAIDLEERMKLGVTDSQRPVLGEAWRSYVRDVLGERQRLEAQVDAVLDNPNITPIKVGLTSGASIFAIAGSVGNPFVGLMLGSYMGYRFYRASHAAREMGGFHSRALTGEVLGTVAHLKLGSFFNLFSSIVNLTQIYLNTSAILPYSYVGRAHKMVAQMVFDIGRGTENENLHMLRRHNIDPVFKHSEVSPHLYDKPHKLERYSMFFFDTVEKFNRSITFLAAYEQAIDGNAKAPRGTPSNDVRAGKIKATPGAAQRYAMSVVNRTQFDYSNVMKPEILRNTFLRVPLQFKNFVAQQIAFVVGLKAPTGKAHTGWATKEVGKFLAHMFLIAGVLGLPGLQLLDWLVEWLTGESPSVEVKRIALKMQAQGEFAGTIGTAIAHGIPGLLGVDISTRVGMGDKFLPQLRIDDLIGPAASTLVRARDLAEVNATFTDQMRNLSTGLGGPLKSLESLANGIPVEYGIRNPLAFYEALTDDKIVIANPRKQQKADVDLESSGATDLFRFGFLTATGGKPRELTQLYDFMAVERFGRTDRAKKSAQVRSKIGQAYRAYMPHNLEDFRKELSRIRTEAAEDGYVINNQSLRRLIRELRMGRVDRIVKQSPRQLRPELLELRQGMRQ